MRILGIDPGLAQTGYGVVDVGAGTRPPRLVEAGVIRTRRTDALAARLSEIQTGLAAVLEEFRPEAVAVEQLYSHYAHPRTAILMGHARGVILQRCAEAGVAVKSFSATRIKKSLTGNGRASKEQVQRTIKTVLALTELPEPSDVADAIAAAMCCANSMNGVVVG